ncbi:flavin monoamine oxidase family protein [Salinimicrobium oceani]|uniref:Tryptophan 2-monooxygenase n=1 Tax=Salinimicrobium oceani TaxID=2722702 RepID=A0ABX1D000_9FLAO|nr:NAD(P)/FAD-dependent oxidoreductase [Salinimicrobium oceani]NJW52494.1 FAD-dependent oxidoreductase [Salinimicrobium oceani]
MEISETGGITRKAFLEQLGFFGTGLLFAGSLGAAEFLSTRTKSPKKIIVLGAGLAGLAAGWNLKEAGHDVVILEARDRPGGKVSTLREPFAAGLIAEEGAAAFSNSYTTALKFIDRYGLEKVPWALPEKPVTYFLNGKRFDVKPGEKVTWPYELTSEEQELGPFGIVQKYIINTLPKDIRNPSAWNESPLLHLDQESLESYLQEQGASPGAIQLIKNTQWFAAVPGETSALAMAVSDFGLFMGDVPFTLKGGNDLLPREMAKEMQDDIHYEMPVETIRDLGSEVVVKSRQGKEFKGDKVIVALPLKVLQKINFSPALSREKSAAINEVQVLDLARVFLKLKEPVWFQKGLSGQAFTDLPIAQLNAYENPETPLSNPAILESFLAGEAARNIGGRSKDEIAEMILTHAEKVHPGVKNNFTEAYIKNWVTDEYSLGGPSWPGPGTITSHLVNLQVPQGNLHFAGEHTSILRSTMEGALRSGMRAAKEIHEA